jgi:hypothetical protein
LTWPRRCSTRRTCHRWKDFPAGFCFDFLHRKSEDQSQGPRGVFLSHGAIGKCLARRAALNHLPNLRRAPKGGEGPRLRKQVQSSSLRRTFHEAPRTAQYQCLSGGRANLRTNGYRAVLDKRILRDLPVILRILAVEVIAYLPNWLFVDP